MKLIKFISFFLFAVTCCISYADENKYIFVGQNGSDGKTAFILELIGDELKNHVQISENGEVYLKVDKITAIPKETFSHFAHLANLRNASEHSENVGNFAGNAATTFLALNTIQDNYEDQEVRCPKCRFTYVRRPGHWDCPRCYPK